MFRVLTSQENVVFKTTQGIYEIEIKRKVDNKGHVTVVKMDEKTFEDKLVLNKYNQKKSIVDKDAGYYTIIEEFYPDVLVEEADENEGFEE